MRNALAALSCVMLLAASAPIAGAAEGAAPAQSPPVGDDSAQSPYAESPEVFKKRVPPPPRIPLDPPLRPLTPDEVEIGPLLMSLEGVSAVMVRGRDNQVRPAAQGALLQPGDTFQTGEKGSARLAFERGVQVLVASGTVVTVQSHGDVPMVTVDKGEVRSMVESGVKPGEDGKPEPRAEESPKPATRPFKFLIRTPAAVMGVRGTDFVVQTDENKASVHTFTGIVDVGHDLTEVKTGQGVPVPASHFAESEGGKRIQLAERFDVGEFLKEFNERNPKMEELWNQAARDVRQGGLARKFRKVREQVADMENRRRGLLPEALNRDAKDKGKSSATSKSGHHAKRKRKKSDNTSLQAPSAGTPQSVNHGHHAAPKGKAGAGH